MEDLKCQVCFSKVSNDMKFCTNCGSKLEKRCSVCNCLLDENWRYCKDCGIKINTKKTENQSEKEKPQKTEGNEENHVNIKYLKCQKCGSVYDFKKNHCPICETEIALNKSITTAAVSKELKNKCSACRVPWRFPGKFS